MQVGDVSVYRPQEYKVGQPSFRGELAESCLNRYRMYIDPLSFTEDRCSFSWRSPGIGSVCSPNLFMGSEIERSARS